MYLFLFTDKMNIYLNIFLMILVIILFSIVLSSIFSFFYWKIFSSKFKKMFYLNFTYFFTLIVWSYLMNNVFIALWVSSLLSYVGFMFAKIDKLTILYVLILNSIAVLWIYFLII